MATLNATLVPWLIAEYGADYASWDHVETATEMITHIVTKEQLGGYTKRTFTAIVDGHRVQQLAFTKFVFAPSRYFQSILVSKPQLGNLKLMFFGLCQARPPLSIAMIFATVSKSSYA